MHPADKPLLTNFSGEIIEIRGGYQFDLGGLTVDVVDLIGHTAGSIGFLDSQNRRFFTGDAIGSRCCWMHLTKLPLESLLDALREVERLRDRWSEIWQGHYNELDRPLTIDYVLKMKELVENLVRRTGRFEGKLDHDMQARFELEEVPVLIENDGVWLYYLPGRMHWI
jgi:glyoxylase-like metal-dependent hydrolase (beta-lactamase superfamily II)